MEQIRKPKHAGSFYPDDEKELTSMINGFLSQAKTKKHDGKLKALIVPHAGYIYSGQTAAFAFKLLTTAKPKRIVLTGPSHYDYLDDAFGFSGEWETPLGKTAITKSGLNTIQSDREHSLEVELPFLQTVLGDFEFVPIIYGEINPIDLAFIQSELSNNNTVLVASSDLSHYFPYEKANAIDRKTINSILSLDAAAFLSQGDACGKTGIASLLLLAQKHKWKPVLLDYHNSGDTSGDKKSVVGYCTIAFFYE